MSSGKDMASEFKDAIAHALATTEDTRTKRLIAQQRLALVEKVLTTARNVQSEAQSKIDLMVTKRAELLAELETL